MLSLDQDVVAHEGLVSGHAARHAQAPGRVVLGYMPTVRPPRRPGSFVIERYADEYERRRLSELIGRPELAEDPGFATMKARAAHVDEVDEMVSGWTRGQTREAIMTALNGVDVFCGIVKELPEVMTDPHLHARGMLREIDDPRLGRITMWTSPLRMNAEAPVPQSLAPVLGADGDEFLRAELGLDEAAIAALRQRKVI